jgi:hypothetical protein
LARFEWLGIEEVGCGQIVGAWNGGKISVIVKKGIIINLDVTGKLCVWKILKTGRRKRRRRRFVVARPGTTLSHVEKNHIF